MLKIRSFEMSIVKQSLGIPAFIIWVLSTLKCEQYSVRVLLCVFSSKYLSLVFIYVLSLAYVFCLLLLCSAIRNYSCSERSEALCKQSKGKKRMGRNKIPMKKIEKRSDRQVTFSKRRSGLLKKAKELSILCEAEVGVIIFSDRGKLFHQSYGTRNMESLIQRYYLCKQLHSRSCMTNIQPASNLSVEKSVQKMQETTLGSSLRISLGKELCSLCPSKLKELEEQLEIGKKQVRLRKDQLSEQKGKQIIGLKCSVEQLQAEKEEFPKMVQQLQAQNEEFRKMVQQLQAEKDDFRKMVCEGKLYKVAPRFPDNDVERSCTVSTTKPPQQNMKLPEPPCFIDLSLTSNSEPIFNSLIDHDDGGPSTCNFMLDEWNDISEW